MPVGTVKWFDTRKGYGFIVGDGDKDVFVHYTHITGDGFRSLKDGEKVEYDLIETDKGFQARNVRHAEDKQSADASAGSSEVSADQATSTSS